MFWVARLENLRIVEWPFATVGERSGYETEPEWGPETGSFWDSKIESFLKPFGTQKLDRFRNIFEDKLPKILAG